MKNLIVIADWVDDSLTIQEFRTAVNGFLKSENDGSHISFVSSTPSTIHTAFLISQSTETEERYGRPLETIIFENTDPRLTNSNEGAKFLILKLKSGLYICGPNAGYDFSLVKSKIDEAFVYTGLVLPSQFRSRDFYSRICGHLMDEMEDEMDLEEIQTDIIPVLIGHHIGHIDNFGNIKTTIEKDELKGKIELNDCVNIKINNIEKKVRYVDNLFGGNPGELVIYPGSSGTPANPYLEITVWRHFDEKDQSTGIQVFDYPRPGDPIHIQGLG